MIRSEREPFAHQGHLSETVPVSIAVAQPPPTQQPVAVSWLIQDRDNLLFQFGNDHNTIDVVNSTGNVILTGTGDDNITVSGGGKNAIDTGAGDDTVDAYNAQGGQLVFTGAGQDFFQGGLGDDRFEGGDGDDAGFGDFGNDTLSGGDGNDVLDGDAGRNVLSGGAGQDFVWAHVGDTVSLGSGADTLALHIQPGDRGMIVVTDFESDLDSVYPEWTPPHTSVTVHDHTMVIHNADYGISVTVVSLTGSLGNYSYFAGDFLDSGKG